MSSRFIETAPEISSAAGTQATVAPLRVYMLDLLPTVPYYTGSLCAGLKDVDGAIDSRDDPARRRGGRVVADQQRVVWYSRHLPLGV